MARLGDLCDILNGYAFKSEQYVDSGIRIIRIANVQKGYIEDSAPVFYPIDNSEYKKYELKEDDLLLSLTGNVGRVALLEKEFLPAALNQRVACLRIKDETTLNKSFLFNFLNSDYFENKCIESAKGVAQKNMSTEWLKEYKIPLFSMETQEKISKELDQISNLISLRKQQLSKLDELVKSRFIEMFGNPVSNDKGWQHQAMDKVAPSSAGLGDNSETVWLLNLDMVEAQTGRILDYLYVEKEQVGTSTCAFDEGNVLYSKLRPYLNKVVVPTKKGYCTTELVPLRPNGKLNRQFLAYLLRSEAFVSFINEKVAGAKMPRVSMSIFRDFECILPSIDLQNEFATFAEQVDKSKFEIQKSLEKLETLKKALMQKYFG